MWPWEKRKAQSYGQKPWYDWVFGGELGIRTLGSFWEHDISSVAPSTTRTTLRVYFRPVFFPEICSKIRWRENRRESKKYSILRFSVLRNIKENQGDEIPSFCRNFESAPLWPLRYLSIWCNAIYSTILRGKMQGCGERRLAKKQNFSQKTKKSNWLFPFDVVI